MHRWLLILCAALLALGSQAQAAGKRRVLYFTQTESYRHETILPLGLQVLKELGAKDNAFDVDTCDDCTKWTPAYFAPYDAIVSYGSGELPLTDANKQALLDAIRGGKAFVGIHSATWMCYKTQWPAYNEMLGGFFASHPWNQTVRVIVEDKVHPATAHLGDAFEIKDEIYLFAQWDRAKTHVLLSMDNASVDAAKGESVRKDRDYGLAWCHPYGKGRVFYTAFGHYPEVWKDPRFQTHLRNGILWALGDVAGECPLGSDGRKK
jgi:uncharacterized protein